MIQAGVLSDKAILDSIAALQGEEREFFFTEGKKHALLNWDAGEYEEVV